MAEPRNQAVDTAEVEIRWLVHPAVRILNPSQELPLAEYRHAQWTKQFVHFRWRTLVPNYRFYPNIKNLFYDVISDLGNYIYNSSVTQGYVWMASKSAIRFDRVYDPVPLIGERNLTGQEMDLRGEEGLLEKLETLTDFLSRGMTYGPDSIVGDLREGFSGNNLTFFTFDDDDLKVGSFLINLWFLPRVEFPEDNIENVDEMNLHGEPQSLWDCIKYEFARYPVLYGPWLRIIRGQAIDLTWDSEQLLDLLDIAHRVCANERPLADIIRHRLAPVLDLYSRRSVLNGDVLTQLREELHEARDNFRLYGQHNIQNINRLQGIEHQLRELNHERDALMFQIHDNIGVEENNRMTYERLLPLYTDLETRFRRELPRQTAELLRYYNMIDNALEQILHNTY